MKYYQYNNSKMHMISKKMILLLIIIGSSITLSAQSSVRTLEDFSSLKVAGAFNVELIKGTSNQVEIIGVSEETLENLATEIKEGNLTIYAKAKIKATADMVIKLTFVNLEKMEISGACNISNKDNIAFNNLTVVTSGASNIDLNLNAQVLALKSSGASSVKLEGTAQEFNLDVSGATDLKAGKLAATTVVVKASGASDLTVNATTEINGTVSGASDLKVLGEPATNKVKVSGASGMSSNDNVKVSVGNSKVLVEGDDVTITGVANSDVKVVNDTTKIRMGRTNVLIISDSISVTRTPKKRRNHWAGIDLGINGFVNNQGSFNLNHDISLEQTSPKKVTQFMELDYSKSWVFSLNFYEHFFKIYQQRFGLVTGLGLEYNNYELKHNVRLVENGGSYVSNNVNAYNENYTWGVVDTNVSFSKNRFKTFYINAPLMFEINTGDHKNKSFHLSAGAIFGYKFTTRMKYIYKENGDQQKVKDDNDFNTNPFKVALTARVGVGWLNVFATYSLTPLFESGRGPELYPFSVGVTLLGF
jgi:hypothetical protein